MISSNATAASSHPPAGLRQAQHLVTEQVGAMMEFWGFKRILGRIWSVLYLSEDCLSAAEIGDALDLSASAVSVALGELRRWGVVREAVGRSPGNGRAQRWQPETDIWHMVTNVMRQREAPLLQHLEEALQEALAALDEDATSSSVRHARAALKNLLSITAVGKALLNSLLDTGRVNAHALRKFKT